MNRYLNTYNTYESKLNYLLSEGYEFEEASEIAQDNNLFNNEVFETKETSKNNEIDNLIEKHFENIEKSTASDQRVKGKRIKEMEKDKKVLLYCYIFGMLIWVLILFITV